MASGSVPGFALGLVVEVAGFQDPNPVDRTGTSGNRDVEQSLAVTNLDGAQ